MTRKRRLDVRCVCGAWGLLVWTGRKDGDKDICNFTCGCLDPEVDFDNPYLH